MKESVHHVFTIPISPARAYAAWLDSEEHSNMTGGEAHCSDVVGDTFTAWDGYINGENIALKEHQEIIQSWRTSDFDAEDDDSELKVKFLGTVDGCQVSIIHTNIPEGQTQYESGWLESYINPMQEYFDV
jgi:activator of HSP90 ATPase